MDRPITLLRLPDEVKSKLQSFGFNYLEDVERCLNDSSEVPRVLRPVFDEYKILDKMKAFEKMSAVISAGVLLQNSSPFVAVFHEGLAKLLNGGLPVGQITELCGEPGSGKTQMCLQFCADVQIPSELGGSSGEALFISTDFGFQVDRFREICQGTIDHFAAYVGNSGKEYSRECLTHLSVESLLKGVKVMKIYELSMLYEALVPLKNFFESNANIKLVVLDSFSILFILDVQDPSARTKTVAFFLNTLFNYAVKHKFALVLTNQLTTVVRGENDSYVKPALGHAYAHRIHQRLILRENKAYLAKCISSPQVFTNFKVTKSGLR